MTKSRKRMLLSSIAMLLVALVALGSATYAWFTVNKTVTADTMKVTAATSAGLQITGDNGENWVRDFHFDAITDSIDPTSLGFTASAIQTQSYRPAEVEREGAYVEASGTTSASAINWAAADTIPKAALAAISGGDKAQAVTANKQIVGYRVGVRTSQSEATIPNVTLTLGLKSGSTKNADAFLRAVVVDSNDAVVAYYAGGGATAVTAVASNLPSATAAQPTTDSLTHIIASVTNTAQYFNIYVWYEGQDDACVDENQGAQGEFNISFSYV